MVAAQQGSDGIVRMRGLPTRASVADVLAFFEVGCAAPPPTPLAWRLQGKELCWRRGGVATCLLLPTDRRKHSSCTRQLSAAGADWTGAQAFFARLSEPPSSSGLLPTACRVA